MSDHPGEKIVSRAAAVRSLAEDHDPILAGMIDRGVPLSRNAYLMLADHPVSEDGWTAEHEASVPSCFRDESAITAHPSGRRQYRP
jgi:hypothetical protein